VYHYPHRNKPRDNAQCAPELVGAFGCNALGIPVAMGVLYPFISILLLPLIAAAAWPSAR
jgi:hypothetical protein